MTADDLPEEIRDIPRAKEIVDIMNFFEFGFKPSSRFEGTICFTFNIGESDRKLQYIVRCKKQGLRALLVGKDCSADAKYDCEVTSSIEDFLHVYSGKASASEMASMCYTGRVYISGLQFRLVTRFVQAFDFTSQKWNDFYSWQAQERSRACLGPADDQAYLDRIPRQIAVYIRGGGVNMSLVQRSCFEASMGKIFGPRQIVTYMALVHQGLHLPPAIDASYHFRSKKFGRAVRSVIGFVPKSVPTKCGKPSLRNDILMLWDEAYPLIPCHHIVPASSDNSMLMQWNDGLLVALQDKYDINDNETAVHNKDTGVHESRRRVDLRDAGMTQLSKIMDNVIGVHLPVTKSNYLSAPARFMCEVRKLFNQAHDQPTSSTPLHTVLRDIDAMINAQLGKPVLVRPAPSMQKEMPTTEIIRLNTRRDLARMKKSIAGLKQNLLAHQMSSKPDTHMNYLMLDY
ncbi:Aste57867_15274 [Aphanomyces stellatus]|uniref:Aste57867_15274 protein n=1 Tax=Aphanomyces stellatus TaxID=120398 RepID=A0A485L3C4_9STRA|nr:hypothetical protein As57867_015218 [Aphanomyces stellatus]VFT92083.1 Aste57867_15274 [Aphanomyces stellatus]